jgi:hypothetical protein
MILTTAHCGLRSEPPLVHFPILFHDPLTRTSRLGSPLPADWFVMLDYAEGEPSNVLYGSSCLIVKVVIGPGRRYYYAQKQMPKGAYHVFRLQREVCMWNSES